METIQETLARVGREVAARERRVERALSQHPDGYIVQARRAAWVKETIAGDVFWTNGKKYLTGGQLLENLGSRLIAPHVPTGLLDDFGV